jgi:hypothetical protein
VTQSTNSSPPVITQGRRCERRGENQNVHAASLERIKKSKNQNAVISGRPQSVALRSGRLVATLVTALVAEEVTEEATEEVTEVPATVRWGSVGWRRPGRRVVGRGVV